jgi:hypothetical protein
MRDISIDEPTGTMPVHTFLNYGDTRSGKTVFAATFPRPLIIADVGEGGYTSIRTMDRDTWFEPGVAPIIKGVENMNDLAAFYPELKALVAAKRVLTVVHDAFSFYADFFLTKIVQGQGSPDMREAYGLLGQHLRKVRTDYHALGINVVWNCLAKHPEKDVPKGRPLIPGQEADKFAAAVTFLLYSRVEQRKVGGAIHQEHQIRTRQYGSYIAGNREGIYADNLPDPFTGTYAEFITATGYDPDAIRANLPKPGQVATVAPAAPKPPVTITKPSAPGASPKASGTVK